MNYRCVMKHFYPVGYQMTEIIWTCNIVLTILTNTHTRTPYILMHTCLITNLIYKRIEIKHVVGELLNKVQLSVLLGNLPFIIGDRYTGRLSSRLSCIDTSWYPVFLSQIKIGLSCLELPYYLNGMLWMGFTSRTQDGHMECTDHN